MYISSYWNHLSKITFYLDVNIYEADFKEGIKEWKANIHYKNGNIYKGIFKED